MQDWISDCARLSKEIEKHAATVEIHKCRFNTLSRRVKTTFDIIASEDIHDIDTESSHQKITLKILLATYEEIADYLKLLQNFGNALEKRVKSFGSDEEMFLKWNETLRTCCIDLNLIIPSTVFDEDQDLGDFDADLQALIGNLGKIYNKSGNNSRSVEVDMEASQKLLNQQQVDRTQYKTQQAVKAEKQFDPKLLRYDKLIGVGGNLNNRLWTSLEGRVSR